jgi:hypothetical protein
MSILEQLNFSFEGGHPANHNYFVKNDSKDCLNFDYQICNVHEIIRFNVVFENIKYEKYTSSNSRTWLVESGFLDVKLRNRTFLKYAEYYLDFEKKDNYCDLCKYEDSFPHSLCKYQNSTNVPYRIYKGRFYGFETTFSYIVYFPKGFLPWNSQNKYSSFVDLFDKPSRKNFYWHILNNEIFFGNLSKNAHKFNRDLEYKIERKISKETRDTIRDIEIDYIDKLNYINYDYYVLMRPISYFSEVYKYLEDIRIILDYNLWI